jgi:ribonuclease P protein component
MPRITQTLTTFSTLEVSAFFKRAKLGLRNAGLTILYAPRTLAFGRILLITSRKAGNAPQRNRIRRQLRAIFYADKLYERGFDCAVIVRAPAMDYSFDALRTLCTTALDTAAKNSSVKTPPNI